MTNKVIISQPKTGSFVRESKSNPDWVSVFATQKHVELNNGIVNVRNRSTWIRMSKEAFNLLNYKLGDVVENAKIVRKLSYTPFYEGQESVVNPQTGEVILHEGREYYQQFTVEGLDSQDSWVVNIPVEEEVSEEETVSSEAEDEKPF